MANLQKYKFEVSSVLERGLTAQQTSEIKEDLKFARRYLNALTDRIEKELENKIEESEGVFNYEQPNWAYKQAELLGYRRALRKIKEFIRPIENEE